MRRHHLAGLAGALLLGAGFAAFVQLAGPWERSRSLPAQVAVIVQPHLRDQIRLLGTARFASIGAMIAGALLVLAAAQVAFGRGSARVSRRGLLAFALAAGLIAAGVAVLVRSRLAPAAPQSAPRPTIEAPERAPAKERPRMPAWARAGLGLTAYALAALGGAGLAGRVRAGSESAWVVLVMLAFLSVCMATERGGWRVWPRLLFVPVAWFAHALLLVPVAYLVGRFLSPEVFYRGIAFAASLPVVLYAMWRSRLFAAPVAMAPAA